MVTAPDASSSDPRSDLIDVSHGRGASHVDTWERSALRCRISPGDNVLESPGGGRTLTALLAALAGWVTVIEERAERLAALRAHLGVCGWPNVTLAPRLGTGGAISPYDVVVAPWPTSDGLRLEQLASLAERRIILHGPLTEGGLDELRATAQALDLDVTLERPTAHTGEPRAIVTLDVHRNR